jgi:DNA-binding response OmpR family regulator
VLDGVQLDADAPARRRRALEDWTKEQTMGYTPAFDDLGVLQPTLDRPTLTQEPIPATATRETLRFGGLTMDSVTGAVTYRGRPINLPVPERELLGALLRRAGQIVSCERLAAAIGDTTSAVDVRIASLKASLQYAGSSTVPCDVDGIGYVLWRC